MEMIKSLHFWRVWLIPHLLLALSIGMGWFGWEAAAAWFVFYTLISGLGVAVGFHRYFSHKAFKTSKFWEQMMLYWGSLACHGHPLFWVALHRGLHHRYADTDRDPHSPVVHSLWQSYQGYAFDPELVSKVPLRAGADFLRHPDWQWTVQHYHKVLWGTWLAVALISFQFSIPWLLAGLAAAQVWAIHQEALVNVVGHVSGFGSYRNYEIDDKSVNRNILGLFTWGQALHNNHHGDAGNPDFGAVHKWEFDPSMLWINAIKSRNV